MNQRFARHCDREFSWDPNQPLVVACSSGLDSTVLIYLMHAYHGNLILAHMNYGLRGDESDQDEAFVVALGAELGYEVVVERVAPEMVKNQPQVSLQMKARELRYAFFENLMRTRKAQGVLTAHHADDNLETFLINFSRGTGLKGLTGIKAQSDRLFRPMLGFKREEILAYAQKKGYTWRDDESNQSDDYQRNIIRHHISPGFNKLKRPWDQSLAQTQDYLNQADRLLQDYINQIAEAVITTTEDGLCLDLKALKSYPNERLILSTLCRDYGVNAGQDVHQLAQAQSGARLYTKTHELLKDREVILINPIEVIQANDSEVPGEKAGISAEQNDTPEYWLISDKHQEQSAPIQFSFEPVDSLEDLGPEVLFVPTQMLEFPIKVRRWQNGDVFYPFGGPGKKKISKFFKDERLSLVRKNKTWLLECGDRIMWVVGLRGDERFRVPPDCKIITKISWRQGE
jgi:tRNA(Ile)-lysidine synthase